MDNHKKLDFIHKMAKLGLQHFDAGGTVQASDTTLGGPSGASTNGSQASTNGVGQIAGALGLNNNFQAQSANIQQGTNAAQLNAAYTGTQNALNSGDAITNQLAPQVSSAVANQNTVANQLSQEAQGLGANPAQAALNQNTAANTANQAALMAGQRGSSSNVGLLARQAAQQGSANQQNAVGQEATLAAQQQLNAQNALAGLSANQIGQTQTAANASNTNQQGEQNILQNANSAANNNAVGMQSNINNNNQLAASQNAGIAQKTLGGLGNAVSAVSSLFAKGGTVEGPHKSAIANYLKGGTVKAQAPNQKAVVKGDSYSNDKVPAELSEGEVVIDRDTLNDKGPMGQMARALKAHLAKKKGKK